MDRAPLVAGGRVWVDTDVFDIDRRIKEGDESGWRGDPSMYLCYDQRTGRFEVWGTDRGGRKYIAASHHACDQTLLTKLVMGDPTKNDVIGRVFAENAKLKAEQDAKVKDRQLEIADKIGFAIRTDLGHLHGGRNRKHSMYQGKKAGS
jgi:hypothetical protein